MNRAIPFLGFAFVVIMLAASVDAKPGEGEPHRCGPPPEAVEACEGLKAGDLCSFDGPEGSLEGSCFTPDKEKPLACRPDNAPPAGKGRRGPPPEQRGGGSDR